MARLRFNRALGALDVALATGDTTLSSPGLATLGVVAGPDVAALTISTGTAYEIVWVTAHAAAATTATIVRAQEGTAAQAWAVGTAWVHGPTSVDFTFAKADVGLGNVDNTSDLAKFTSPALTGAPTLNGVPITVSTGGSW